MDQPLDLSQRESESNKQSAYNMDVEEPICQFQNCSCPLKHITTLESPKHRQSPPGEELYMSHQTTTEVPYDGRHGQMDYDNGVNKRSFIQDCNSNPNFYHPKRRKIEMYKQRIARSTSETRLSTYDDPYASINEYPGYSPNGDISYASQEKSQDYYSRQKDINSQSVSSLQSEEASMDPIYPPTTCEEDYRERSFSTSHIQRLPKKRQYPRHYSTTMPSMSQLSQNNSHIATTQAPSTSQRFYQPRTKQAPCATITRESEGKENEKNNQKSKASSIKEEMMRQIDNSPDTDDIATFRKQLFETIVKSAKFARDARMKSGNPGGLVALDYLISKNALHTEEKPFKSRNNHLQQIIRGEKPGKLCLMDIVELQVEIGLA